MEKTVTPPVLAIKTCERRLAPVLGSAPGENRSPVDTEVSWHGPAKFAAGRCWSEASTQAVGGLMEVHGRDAGRPRRLGLDVASVAGGVLAAQGVLAALVGRSRGHPVARVETSVLQACLVLVSHYVAVATCSEGSCSEEAAPTAGPAPGPPFRSSEGHWFEIETLDPEAWRSFWFTLGYAGPALGAAWTAFRQRYNRGACSLPPGLHEATARRSLDEIAKIASDCAVSLCPLRSYDEVLEEPGVWEGHPVLSGATGPLVAYGHVGVAPASTHDELPLNGIRVVEATNRVQGPLAGLLLQMLGADVLLVEPPGGDVARMGTPAVGDTGAFFLSFNRGKQSTELDLNTGAGREALSDLVAGADVFVQNWRPGKAEQWGLDHQRLAECNPALVYVEASGWGEAEQPRHLLGTDFMVQAYAGMGNGINPEHEDPFPTRALVTDYLGGLLACEGALRGLYRREVSGQGCRAETSLLAAAMALQVSVLEPLAGGREEGRRHGRPVWGRLDHPLEATDGFLVLSLGDDTSFRRACAALGVADGGASGDAEEALARRIESQPAAATEEALVGAGVACAEACTDVASLPADARLAHLFEPLGAKSRVPASPWRFSS